MKSWKDFAHDTVALSLKHAVYLTNARNVITYWCGFVAV